MRCLLLLLWVLLFAPGNSQLPAPPIPYAVSLFNTPAPGYIFLTPQSRFATFDNPGCLMILDSAGNQVFYAPLLINTEPPYINTRPFDFRVHPNGIMSYAPSAGPSGYTFYHLDSNFQLVDTITCGQYITDEHEMVITSDDHIHLICSEFAVRDASGLLMADTVTYGSPNCSVKSNLIVELDENKNEVFSWAALDHIPIEDTQSDFYTVYSNLDHVHSNSIEFDLDSNYVISNRNLSEVTKINRQTGDIMWRLGGKANQFQLIGDSVFFNGQHYAQVAPNGNLYVFDNARFGTQQISRYLEYELDTSAMTATLVREIQHPTGLNTAIMGNAQLMDNDGVIITWGGFFVDTYPANISEYDAADDIVMEIDFPNNWVTYRVHKQEVPFTIEQPEVDCDPIDKTLIAPPGHIYEWNTGETVQTITVDTPGTYYVWVDQGIGFLRSRDIHISQLTDICLDVSNPEPVEFKLSLHPNPTDDLVVIRVPSDVGDEWTLDVFDPRGRLVIQQSYKGEFRVQVNLEERPDGIYFFRARDDEKSYSGRILKH